MWPLALPSAGPERDGLLTQCHAGCRDESQPRPGPVVTPPRLSWELAEGCRVTLHDVTCGRTSQTLRLLAPLCSGRGRRLTGGVMSPHHGVLVTERVVCVQGMWALCEHSWLWPQWLL